MAIVTVYAGASGEPTEVTFDRPASPGPGSDAHGDGDAGPSPYGYVLLGLGA
jgi:uncharacterized OsmC-like protein